MALRTGVRQLQHVSGGTRNRPYRGARPNHYIGEAAAANCSHCFFPCEAQGYKGMKPVSVPTHDCGTNLRAA